MLTGMTTVFTSTRDMSFGSLLNTVILCNVVVILTIAVTFSLAFDEDTTGGKSQRWFESQLHVLRGFFIIKITHTCIIRFHQGDGGGRGRLCIEL